MSNYYYNGVLLPEIPHDELVKCPYYFIRYNGTNYQLLMTSYPLYYADTYAYISNESSYSYRQYEISTDSWVYLSGKDNAGGKGGWYVNTTTWSLIFSSHDMPNGSANATDIYFYGSEPVPEGGFVKYYYNGVLLPEIPSDVLVKYPYCWIRNNTTSGNYDLLLTAYRWYYDSSGKLNFTASGNSKKGEWYTIAIEGSENAKKWIFKSDLASGNFNINDSQTVLWSNHDIPKGSTTSTNIYFYATEPVPEGGQEPDEPDSSEVKKYLIRSQNVLYTISDGTLTALESAELSVDVFRTHGFDELPDWSVISSLVNPEIMYCQSDTEAELPTITSTMTATPYPQTVISPNYSMTDDTILGVECAYVTASSDVVFAISVDDGVTWHMWTGHAWGTLTDTATGMTAETINAITTEQWAELMTTGQFKVRMTLFDENSSFTSFVMDYIN